MWFFVMLRWRKPLFAYVNETLFEAVWQLHKQLDRRTAASVCPCHPWSEKMVCKTDSYFQDKWNEK